MAMDHAKVASEVVEAVGGAANITAAAHCATRLRLVLADEKKIDQAALDANEDLKGTFAAGGMYQIIVGPGDVDIVYTHMVADHGVREVSKDEAKEEAAKSGNIFSRFIKMIADIFVPILPALVAGGLMMAINNVLTAQGLFGPKSVVEMFPWVADYANLINMVSAAAFAALPVLVGFSAAKRFGGNVYLGAALGAAMISGDLLNAWNTGAALAGQAEVQYWHMFGMDVAKIGYQAQVIPTLAVTYVMCLIEKQLHKRLSGTVDFLLTPLVTLLVTGFLAFIAIGPVTRILAQWLTDGINWGYTTLGPIGGLLFGLVYSPIVVTGLHQSFPAVEIPLLPVNGGIGDFIFPIASMANIAQGAAALAVFAKTRDAKLKGLAGAGGASAVFGITDAGDLRRQPPPALALLHRHGRSRDRIRGRRALRRARPGPRRRRLRRLRLDHPAGHPHVPAPRGHRLRPVLRRRLRLRLLEGARRHAGEERRPGRSRRCPGRSFVPRRPARRARARVRRRILSGACERGGPGRCDRRRRAARRGRERLHRDRSPRRKDRPPRIREG